MARLAVGKKAPTAAMIDRQSVRTDRLLDIFKTASKVRAGAILDGESRITKATPSLGLSRARPFAGAVVTKFKQQGQVKSHTCFGDHPPPPGAAPLVGDRVVHDAIVRPLRIETVLVNEQREGTFDHFIF